MTKSLASPVSGKEITALFDSLTERWHELGNEEDNEGRVDFFVNAVRIHRFNYQLWHEEDKARVTDVPDAEIARVKRAIDSYNQQRNDSIERWDEYLINWLSEKGVSFDPNLPMNSETPGSIIDRLSIMSLKYYHMLEQTDRDDVEQTHIDSCKEKAAVLNKQRSDLGDCLDQLIADFIGLRKRLKVYFQFKMYNDPSLNPEVYGRK